MPSSNSTRKRQLSVVGSLFLPSSGFYRDESTRSTYVDTGVGGYGDREKDKEVYIQ